MYTRDKIWRIINLILGFTYEKGTLSTFFEQGTQDHKMQRVLRFGV